jgi:hypothetical protein
MSGSYPLPTEPEGIVAPLLKRFHSGKISAIMPPYDAEAVFITGNEGTITDHTEIAARLERDLAVCLMVKAKADVCSLPAISPGSCWTVQLVAQVTTASTCTSGLGERYHAPRRRSTIALPDRQYSTGARKAAGYMRGTAALTDAAALRPGVDD